MSALYLLALVLAIPVIVPMVWMFVVMITALVRGPVSHCPKCLSKRTRRSMSRLSDKVFLAFVLPRRCESCKHRFYSRPSAAHIRRARTSRALVPAAAQGNSRR
jgi:hypothetical protein